jgi:hypothetical protein
VIQPVLSKPRVGQRLFGFTVEAVRAGFGPRCYEVELRGGRKIVVRVSRPAEPEPRLVELPDYC